MTGSDESGSGAEKQSQSEKSTRDEKNKQTEQKKVRPPPGLTSPVTIPFLGTPQGPGTSGDHDPTGIGGLEELMSAQIIKMSLEGKIKVPDFIATMESYVRAGPMCHQHRVYQHTLTAFLAEGPRFPSYEMKECLIAADILGSLLKSELVPPGPQMRSALQLVLEALQQPAQSKMASFGKQALSKFKSKIETVSPHLLELVVSCSSESGSTGYPSSSWGRSRAEGSGSDDREGTGSDGSRGESGDQCEQTPAADVPRWDTLGSPCAGA
jgi:hypothetical protein